MSIYQEYRDALKSRPAHFRVATSIGLTFVFRRTDAMDELEAIAQKAMLAVRDARDGNVYDSVKPAVNGAERALRYGWAVHLAERHVGFERPVWRAWSDEDGSDEAYDVLAFAAGGQVRTVDGRREVRDVEFVPERWTAEQFATLAIDDGELLKEMRNAVNDEIGVGTSVSDVEYVLEKKRSSSAAAEPANSSDCSPGSASTDDTPTS